jgi:hypothetical protein
MELKLIAHAEKKLGSWQIVFGFNVQKLIDRSKTRSVLLHRTSPLKDGNLDT